MAAQTDAPDDLIAELARLMADDARPTPPATEHQPAPVRIPGEQTASPVPRFDFSASSNLAATRAPASPVRIPGSEPSVSPASQSTEPFSFDFEIAPPRATPAEAAPSATVPAAEPAPSAGSDAPVVPPRKPDAAIVPDEPAMLDQDSLADLIAAELAADLGPDQGAEAPQQPEPLSRNSGPDSFGVPPVFGLGSRQPVAAPQEPVVPRTVPVANPVREQVEKLAEPAPRAADDTPDPLDEIEQLVGPAVRLNAASATPAPSLRTLATPDRVEPAVPAPEPTPVAPAPEANAGVGSVDDAILAAAAATGARVEWVNSNASGNVDFDDVEPTVAPRREGFRMTRAVVGPAVAIALLGVAGFGLYWVLGQGGTSDGPAPLVVADTTPAKDVPVADTTEPAPQSVVFNEISGNNTPADEQIVSRDQADTDAVVAANAPVSNPGVIGDTSGTSVDPNQDGLVNRKVRTVTVRPDGTIVSGNDSLAGSSILPVDRPNVPEVPGADFSTPELLASAGAETPAATTPAATAVAPQATTVAAEPGSSIPVVNAAGTPVAGRTVTVPMQRPSDFSSIAAAAIAAANAAPAVPAPQPLAPQATAPQAAPAAPVTNAAAYVQLASQRSEADALATVQAVTTRYGVLFGGAAPQIQRADLGERGVYYRVLVPAASRESAANICANVKAAGGDCLVL